MESLGSLNRGIILPRDPDCPLATSDRANLILGIALEERPTSDIGSAFFLSISTRNG